MPGALPGEEQVAKDWLAEGGRGDLVGRPERLSLSQRRQAADTGSALPSPSLSTDPSSRIQYGVAALPPHLRIDRGMRHVVRDRP
ncbi:hypothetical protein ACN6LL_001776, partial [Streptomyces violaceoruber]